MDKTWKKKFESNETFVIVVNESLRRSKSELVQTRTVPSPVDGLAWDVKVTVSPAEGGWSVQVDVSAVRPGNPKRLVRVLAQGSVSASVCPNGNRSCGHCGHYGGRSSCSRCRSWLPASKELPLSESSFFNTKDPLLVQSSSSSDDHLQVSLSMTHHEDFSCEPDLTGCKEGKSLVPRLEGLLASGSLADVTFVVSGEEIAAHRAILGAASDVFLAMFTVDTEDMRTGRVKILDVGPAAFKEMLRFLYTDSEPRWTVEDEDAEALLMELLHLSVKYDLDNLLGLCKTHLLSTLSVENVCYRLKMVDVECPSLVPLIATPFIKGHLQEILTTPAWVALEEENASLAARVMRKALTL